MAVSRVVACTKRSKRGPKQIRTDRQTTDYDILRTSIFVSLYAIGASRNDVQTDSMSNNFPNIYEDMIQNNSLKFSTAIGAKAEAWPPEAGSEVAGSDVGARSRLDTHFNQTFLISFL